MKPPLKPALKTLLPLFLFATAFASRTKAQEYLSPLFDPAAGRMTDSIFKKKDADTPAPGSKVSPMALRFKPRVMELAKKIAARTGLEVLGLLWELPGASAVLRDMNKDGLADLVVFGTKDGNSKVSIFLRRNDKWFQSADSASLLDGRQVLQVFTLANDGSKMPGIIVTLRKAPFMLLLPTDGKGRILSKKARSFETWLPKLVRKDSSGEDFTIHSLRPATSGKPAVIEGQLLERTGYKKGRLVNWQLRIYKKDVKARQKEQTWTDGKGMPELSSTPLGTGARDLAALDLGALGKRMMSIATAHLPLDKGIVIVPVPAASSRFKRGSRKAAKADKQMILLRYGPWKVGIMFGKKKGSGR